MASEHELMEEYQASRDTIRKAMNLLIQNGYIQRSQGRRSIVLDIHRFQLPISNIVSFKEVAKSMDVPVETRVVSLELKRPDDNVKKILKLDSENVWVLKRQRIINHEIVILDIDYFNADIITGLTKEIAENSTYEYFEDVLGLHIAYADKVITCDYTEDQDRELMDMKDFNMIISIKGYVYLEDNRIFQYTTSRHRPDYFRYEDMARRISTM
jgi:GntR family trehalose operon transcriptional repressor